MSVTSVKTTTEALTANGNKTSPTTESQRDTVDEAAPQESHPQYQDTIVTIEELRAQLNTCFSCGVSWGADHVSLDCRECGGYSLQRPCPVCDGQCETQWKRDLTMSHAHSKARWNGKCGLSCPSSKESVVPALEKVSANS